MNNPTPVKRSVREIESVSLDVEDLESGDACSVVMSAQQAGLLVSSSINLGTVVLKHDIPNKVGTMARRDLESALNDLKEQLDRSGISGHLACLGKKKKNEDDEE